MTARTLQIATGTKVFLNIAWDKRVPGPPEASEEVVRRAMAGEDLDDEEREGLGEYYVPVVVSEPREDLDKSGKPSIVFDCVFSASLKSRCMKDREFKLYLIELALEHVEEKARMTLSRQVGTPNIASKGKLEPRTVLMPRALVNPNFKITVGVGAGEGARVRASPLVQELPGNSASGSNKEKGKEKGKGNESVKRRSNDITPSASTASPKSTPTPFTKMKPKSILKPTLAANAGEGVRETGNVSISDIAPAGGGGSRTAPLVQEISSGTSPVPGPGIGAERERAADDANSLDVDLDDNIEKLSTLPPLRWKWSKDGERIKIEVDVPNLTRSLHTHSTLDVEPRRLLLHIPQKHFLDINLSLSDEKIGKMGSVPSLSLSDEADEKDIKVSIAEAMRVAALRTRGHNAGEALRLKKAMQNEREREFDVRNARAEWRVAEGKLCVTV